ncbi:carboxyl-terminal processing protease [Cerasibacillus quisquiliarum]|uniref:C-terminal processing peptidase n=1 Tax=Cerasibacillus quisquiliarum TaxID=227865 RepID=A0A511UVX2_9BACI|nr:S41 family peptidase [Cerasibacillus quisquiliarum]MBB5145212.1 carboxyl-terminal processing protease [Cerasibacillus quisquiliarum]GEN29898.1 peptidase S41 [Cerasibacillus quisquiliarum]
MKMRKVVAVFWIVAALMIGFAGGIYLTSSQGHNQAVQEENNDLQTKYQVSDDKMKKINQAYALIKKHFVEEVDDQELIEGAIQGMLSSLEDPYSSYMDIEAMEQFNEQIESSFEGIGAEVSLVNGKITIVAPIKNSPAEKAGLRPNDQVLSVNGESLEGYDLTEAVAKIRGKKGSEVVLEIMRPGVKDIIEVKMIRDTIPIETVYADLKEVDGKKTGVIEITTFSERTAEEFYEYLTKFEEQGMDGLIIDVRGNPGGLLESVEDILQFFVPKDMPYVQIEDREGNRETYHTDLTEKKPYPIQVLIDEGSASASEILAVALKEMGYDVVGTSSFGKGTVQQAVPLGDGSTVKLTFFKWLSPKGNWIHEKGVKPTIEVKQPDYYFTHPIQVEKTLTYNDAGEDIENIQKMLKGLGYQLERMDGYFDKTTEKAVKAFQKEQNIKQTGKVDQETAGLIETALIEKIRSGEDDRQMEKALQTLYK